MKKAVILFSALMFLAMGISKAEATAVLYDWAFNIDGVTYELGLGDTMAGAGVTSGLGADDLGTLTSSPITGVGAHSFFAFLDYEIDEPINTFFNETGASSGTVAAGQSWEIDEPGYINGDIYENVMNGVLDNGIGTSIYGNTSFPDDVSVALGWDFVLAAGETGVITLTIGSVAPLSGFYLSQTDPDSNGETIYFSGDLTRRGGGEPQVPEPATILLLGTGLIGFVISRRKKGLKTDL